MRKIILSFMLILSLTLSMALPASAAEGGAETYDYMWLAPETETTINGQPESSVVTPRDVLIGPYFDSFKFKTNVPVDKFKIIAQFVHSNKLGSYADPMTATITESTAQGSEWSASIQLSAEIQVAIIGEIGVQGGGSYKSNRTKNEAVGYSVTHNVPAGKVGHVDLYYRGYKNSGEVTVWTAWTYDLEGTKRYQSYDVYATLYPSNYLDIYSEAYDTTT